MSEKKTFWRKDRQFCQLSAVWMSFGGHVKLSSANGGRRKGRGRQSPPGIRTAFVRRACRNRAIGLPKPGRERRTKLKLGEIASPLSASSAPFSVENRSVSAESGGVFHRYFPTVLFLLLIMRVIICTIGDYLFDLICNLFELTICFA